jgi:hypothetical protein
MQLSLKILQLTELPENWHGLVMQAIPQVYHNNLNFTNLAKEGDLH